MTREEVEDRAGELESQLDEVEEERDELQKQLDSIAEIVSPEEEAEGGPPTKTTKVKTRTEPSLFQM